MLKNIVPRLVNILVCVPLLLLASLLFLVIAARLSDSVDQAVQSEEAPSLLLIISIIVILSLLIAALAAGFAALAVIVTGHGFPYRRVNKHDWTEGSSGASDAFKAREWIWWNDPRVKGRKIMSHEAF